MSTLALFAFCMREHVSAALPLQRASHMITRAQRVTHDCMDGPLWCLHTETYCSISKPMTLTSLLLYSHICTSTQTHQNSKRTCFIEADNGQERYGEKQLREKLHCCPCNHLCQRLRLKPQNHIKHARPTHSILIFANMPHAYCINLIF